MKKLGICLLLISIVAIFSFAYMDVANDENTMEEIPKLETESLEFGKLKYYAENTALYTIYTQKIDTDKYIETPVNEYVDSLIDSIKKQNFKTAEGVLREKDILVQKIDTYKENNTLNVKVTSKLKRYDENSYNTTSKTFTFVIDE